MRARVPVAILLACVPLSFGSTAAADPVRVVTAGVADAHEGDSTFVLIGSGFRFSGEAPGTLGAPLGDCVIFLCSPGDVVDLSTHATPHLSIVDATTAMFDGNVYENVFLTGDLSFSSASVTTPSVPLGGLVELMRPFTFTGQISAFDNVALNGSPLFATNLVGSGIVTLQFTNDSQVGLQASRVTYEFTEAAPVPEPTTLLLAGAGLAAVARRSLRRGKRD